MDLVLNSLWFRYYPYFIYENIEAQSSNMNMLLLNDLLCAGFL